jgi:nucleotide-binding universal stress UspA family protein
MQSLRQIVVATDFSPGAECAVEAAIVLANLGHARVTLVHVCELGVELGFAEAMATPAFDAELMRVCGDRLRVAADHHARRGVELAPLLRCGKPWEKINNVATEVGASLIVIGRNGAGRASGAELGGVATRVLRTATRPVLVVGLDAVAMCGLSEAV